VPTVAGEDLTATVTFSGLPASHTGFGRKQARVVVDGVVRDGVTLDGVTVAAQAFEVFFPNWDTALVNALSNPYGFASNHPGPGSGTVPNWFYYWNQACGDPNAVWEDGQRTRDAVARVPFINEWDTGYNGPRDAIYVSSLLAPGDGLNGNSFWFWTNRAVQPDGTSVNSNITSGIDAFHTTILHERRHVRQITDSNQLPFWKRNGLARDNAPYSGWSWGRLLGDPYYNHFDPVDGIIGNGNDINLDDDQDDLGKDPRDPTNKDFDQEFNNGADWALEYQAREVETTTDNAKAELDWGSPGKNHQTVNNPNN
jgi:hypothetical protein